MKVVPCWQKPGFNTLALVAVKAPRETTMVPEGTTVQEPLATVAVHGQTPSLYPNPAAATLKAPAEAPYQNWIALCLAWTPMWPGNWLACELTLRSWSLPPVQTDSEHPVTLAWPLCAVIRCSTDDDDWPKASGS